jgi:hypothetical protein
MLGTMARRRRAHSPVWSLPLRLVIGPTPRYRNDPDSSISNSMPVITGNENVDPNPNLVVPRRVERRAQLIHNNQGTWSEKGDYSFCQVCESTVGSVEGEDDSDQQVQFERNNGCGESM